LGQYLLLLLFLVIFYFFLILGKEFAVQEGP